MMGLQQERPIMQFTQLSVVMMALVLVAAAIPSARTRHQRNQ
jgi:hypothetical protein